MQALWFAERIDKVHERVIALIEENAQLREQLAEAQRAIDVERTLKELTELYKKAYKA
ncbi:hypothetical protein LCGC14_2044960, partial [marine sediment metagenome]